MYLILYKDKYYLKIQKKDYKFQNILIKVKYY